MTRPANGWAGAPSTTCRLCRSPSQRWPTRGSWVGTRSASQVARSTRKAGRVASIDQGGEIRFWNLNSPSPEPLRRLEVGEAVGSRAMAFTPDGRRFIAGNTDQITRIWDLEGPPGADPLQLMRGEIDFVLFAHLDPEGAWLAAAESKAAVLWPIRRQRSYRLRGHTDGVSDLAFTPDGDWLFSSSWDRALRRWPMHPAVAKEGEVWRRSNVSLELVEIDPKGEKIAWSTSSFGPVVSPLETEQPLVLAGMRFAQFALAWDDEGRWVAYGGGNSQPADAMIRLWDLEGSEIQWIQEGEDTYPIIETTLVLDAGDQKPVSNIAFLPDGKLLSMGAAGLRLWSVDEGTFEQLADEPGMRLEVSPDKRSAVVRLGSTMMGGGPVVVHDLIEGTTTALPSHGEKAVSIALDPTGEILVSGDEDGIVRISRLDGRESHLLMGHTGSVQAVAISPDGRWIASGSADKSVRLWPMPDLTRRPLQTLPLEELLAKLRSLTNLRVVEDAESEAGWAIEIGPFPGWEEAPDW